ncbi:MAG: xanthine dehydrogenase family protein subunit M [Pseudorhodoplanes sp.]|nr:MAG: xanthine dehydrogenase family protein subunit M [Pseudorhodoplanes sp.]
MSGISNYVAPRSLDEAAELLRAGNVTLLAGGTDLMPQSRNGRTQLRPTLMSIRRVAELRGISEAAGNVRIGALTTISELRDSVLVRERLQALWQACDRFASDQIRNAATIGGNICNASPAGDTLVPLLVLDAQVELASKSNGTLATRAVPIADFLLGPGQTARAATEILSGIVLALPPRHFISSFFKFGTRPALDISLISVGLAARRAGNALHDVRVAFGAVAPRPIRAPAAEAALEGKALDDGVIAVAAAAAEAEIHPISDVRASDWYRREMVRNMFTRVLAHVRDR